MIIFAEEKCLKLTQDSPINMNISIVLGYSVYEYMDINSI